MKAVFQFPLDGALIDRYFGLFFLSLLSGMLQTLPLPTAKCYMFRWEKDNFGKVFCIVHY